MLKVYLNFYNDDLGSVVICDDDTINDGLIMGCTIMDSAKRNGYSRWNIDCLRELRSDEVIDINLDHLYSRGVKLIGDKLIIKGSSGYHTSCVIDLTKREIIRKSPILYFKENPIIIKLVNKNNKFTIFKCPNRHSNNLDRLIISDDDYDDGYVSGCSISSIYSPNSANGYGTGWYKSLLTKIEGDVEFKFDPSYMDLRGDKLLITGDCNTDCIIDLTKGSVKSIKLSDYLDENPQIIKLKKI